MNRLAKTRLVGFLLLAGFLSAVAWHGFSTFGQHRGYPYNTFLFEPEDRFNDFRNLYNLVLNPGQNANDLYDARKQPFQFSFLATAVFGFFCLPADVAVGIYLAVFALSVLAICYRQLRVSSPGESWFYAVTFAFLSYPFLFTFDRANIEGLLFLFLCVFCWAFQHERSGLAFGSLTLALALKPFPGVFLVLFLDRKRFPQFLAIGILAILLNLAAILIRFGKVSQDQWDYLNYYHWLYAIAEFGLYFGNSLWGLLRVAIYAFLKVTGRFQSDDHLEHLNTILSQPYMIAVAVLFLALTFYLLAWEKVFWKKIALLVCAMNLFPYVSGDYKLMHLFIPLFLFINHDRPERLDAVYATLFALLLIPKSYFHLPGLPQVNEGVVLNPLLMALLATLIVASGLRARRRNRAPATAPELSPATAAGPPPG